MTKQLNPKDQESRLQSQDQTAGPAAGPERIVSEEDQARESGPIPIDTGAAGHAGGIPISQPGEDDLHSVLVATETIVYELEQTLTGLIDSTDLFEVPAMDFGDADTTS